MESTTPQNDPTENDGVVDPFNGGLETVLLGSPQVIRAIELIAKRRRHGKRIHVMHVERDERDFRQGQGAIQELNFWSELGSVARKKHEQRSEPKKNS